MRLFVAAVLFLFAAVTSAADRPAADPLVPEHHRAAAAYNADHKGISLVVMVEGRVLFEDYPNGGGRNRPHELASGTKSFSGVMAAAAARDGLLDLDEKVSDTITEWKNDPLKSPMTVRQLLSLTGGLESGERGRPPAYSDAIVAKSLAAPGERFLYGPVPFQVFGELMRRKLAPRNQSPADYIRAVLLTPLGIQVGNWRTDRDGNPHLPSGMAIIARDWAKLGEFVRLGGRWEGEEIIPPKLLDDVFAAPRPTPATASPGGSTARSPPRSAARSRNCGSASATSGTSRASPTTSSWPPGPATSGSTSAAS